MLITVLLGIICVIVNLISYFEKSALGLKLSFFLIFLFLGLRYDFGNDYFAYLNLFIQIGENSSVVLDPSWIIVFEPGWMILNWFFTGIGFFTLNLVLAGIYSYIFYRLIKDYVPLQYQWLSVFLLVFNPAFVLVHSTTMRQTIAILLFIYSLRLINKKQYFNYLLTILLAVSFHFTAIILILVLPYLFYERNINLYSKFFIFFFYLLIFLLAPYLSSFLNQFAALFSVKYESYTDKGVANSGLGFIFYTLIFICVLFYINLQDKSVQLLFRIGSLYFLFMPLSLIIEQTSRFGMYFSISLIVIFPYIFTFIRIEIFRYLFLLTIMFFSLYQFVQFFYSQTYNEYFMNYKSIFSAPQWY